MRAPSDGPKTRPVDVKTVKTALYLDLDNVYSGLNRIDGTAARVFANDPGLLIDWLSTGTDDEGRSFRRRFLVRDCYLNPNVYHWARAQFVAAGFRVIDCPSLTQQGKSSADTHIVLDVVDALNHATRFDEFIICSADADFSPLMTKLRRHDRRTVIVAAGPFSAAYQSVCDTTIGPMQLVGAMTRTEPSTLPTVAAPALAAETIARAAEAIRTAVRASASALPGSTAAGAAQRAVADIAADWAGHHGFAEFLEAEVPDLTLVRNDSGGWVLDPTRHSVPADEAGPDDLVGRICRVTRAPRLTRAQYAVLFEGLAEAAKRQPALGRLGADVRDQASMRQPAVPLGRTAVNFIVQGLLYSGVDPRAGDHSAVDLATKWRANLRTLCMQGGLELTDAEQAAVDDWVLGGLRA